MFLINNFRISSVSRVLFMLALSCGLLTYGSELGFTQSLNPPDLPRSYVDTTFSLPVGGTTHRVNAGDNMQTALDAAQPGDVVELAAGAVFRGNFVLPAKVGDGSIYIISSRLSELPSPKNRVGPEHAQYMPKIVGLNRQPWGMLSANQAQNYRLVGLEITKEVGSELPNHLVRFGTSAITDPQFLPRDIVIDRCYIHGHPADNTVLGVRLDGIRMAVVDSHISDIHHSWRDSQAILAVNGPGPYAILNNYLAAAGENIMFGGGDPGIQDMLPADIEIRGNLFSKPLTWWSQHPSYSGNYWVVKNLLEFKIGERALVSGNIFEHSWPAGQDGTAILIKSVNQDGAALWSVSRHITVSNNVIRSSATGIRISGTGDGLPAGRTSHILIENNLLYDINRDNWGGRGAPFEFTSDFRNIEVRHNSVAAVGSHLIIADGAPSSGLIFKYNIAPHNLYGVKGGGTGVGTATLEVFYPGSEFMGNVIIGGNSAQYPPDNFFVSSSSAVGFEGSGFSRIEDFRLTASSPYRNAASNGKDIGVNVDALLAATSCTLSGACAVERSVPAAPARLRLQ